MFFPLRPDALPLGLSSVIEAPTIGGGFDLR
jgi:hypothetical protein